METRLEDTLDAQLAALKLPLRTLREKHDVLGDVSFRIRYTDRGWLTRVTIDAGPPNMTPAFITEANDLVLRSLKLPRTETSGELMFTDLGPESTLDPAAVNRVAEERALVVRDREKEERRKRNNRLGWVIGGLAVAWNVIYFLMNLP